jgi:hypothetical protein
MLPQGIIAPVPWAWAYGKGMALGRPGMFYWAIVAFTVTKLLLSHTVTIEPKAK